MKKFIRANSNNDRYGGTARYKFLSWDEFREVCMEDAYNWVDNGYTADELTADDILNEYPDDYFSDEYQEATSTERSFTPDEFAEKTIEYVQELQKSDVKSSTNNKISKRGTNMKKFIKANKEMSFGGKAAPKRAIKAFEYDYDEDDEDARYEAEYATIEYATEGVDELSAWVDALKAGIEEYKQEWQPWGGDTSDWEMFTGPDDAEAFAEQVREVKDEIINLSRKLGDVLNVSIYPDEFYK